MVQLIICGYSPLFSHNQAFIKPWFLYSMAIAPCLRPPKTMSFMKGKGRWIINRALKCVTSGHEHRAWRFENVTICKRYEYTQRMFAGGEMWFGIWNLTFYLDWMPKLQHLLAKIFTGDTLQLCNLSFSNCFFYKQIINHTAVIQQLKVHSPIFPSCVLPPLNYTLQFLRFLQLRDQYSGQRILG